MTTIRGPAVAELIFAPIALGVLAISVLTPPSNVARHAGLKIVAVAVGALCVLGLSGILLFHRLLVGFEDFLFAVLPGVLSVLLCGVVMWRSRRAYDHRARD